MNKYFIGIGLPPTETVMAQTIAKKLVKHFGTKSPYDKYPPHITLKVSFPATPTQKSALITHMEKFTRGRPSIPLHLDGFGHFNVGVLYWDIIQESDALTQLQEELCNSLEELFAWVQFAPIEPNGIPHITVAEEGIRGRFKSVLQYAIGHCTTKSELSIAALHLFEKKKDETQWNIIKTFEF